MRTTLIAVSMSISCLLSAVSCDKGSKPLSNEQAIDVAAHHLMGRSFESVPQATVTFANGSYTVVFTRPVPNGAPGEQYATRVVFDAKTLEALAIEVDTAANPKPAESVAPASAEPAPRPTPLNEEVDHVGALQRQLNR